MTTVLTYLDQAADIEAIDSPQRHYALIARQFTDAAAIAERGRRAGKHLAADHSGNRDLVTRVRGKAGAADREVLITTIGAGMRVRTYLPTRSVKLVVHRVDVAFSPRVLADTTEPAACIAVAPRSRTNGAIRDHRTETVPDHFSVFR